MPGAQAPGFFLAATGPAGACPFMLLLAFRHAKKIPGGALARPGWKREGIRKKFLPEAAKQAFQRSGHQQPVPLECRLQVSCSRQLQQNAEDTNSGRNCMTASQRHAMPGAKKSRGLAPPASVSGLPRRTARTAGGHSSRLTPKAPTMRPMLSYSEWNLPVPVFGTPPSPPAVSW